MKIMFVCSGGMSTAMTAKKLEEVSAKNNVEMIVTAKGVGDFEEELQNNEYDIVLIAPQIKHKFKSISEIVSNYGDIKIEKIPPQMYAPMEPAVKKLFDLIQETMSN
jgi:cellobiose PTS system EIIB component